MNEALLHYIWQHRRYAPLHLQTQCGQKLQVLKTGQLNRNAFPDFENAHIKLNAIEWVGHVEIHQRSSDWHQHQHQKNPAYNNVILHVVWHDDMKIHTNSGELVPTLVLKTIVEEELLGRYHFLMKNKAWIPCEKSIGKVPFISINHFFRTPAY